MLSTNPHISHTFDDARALYMLQYNRIQSETRPKGEC